MKLRRFLLINPDQFGYQTDTYQYCRHLRERYDITYVCWDFGFPRIDDEGVHTIYVSRQGNKIIRLGRYIRRVLHELSTEHYNLVFVVHFPLCGILSLMRRKQPMVIDIRTGWVKGNALQHALNNSELRAETLFFDHVTIISEGLREELHINAAKSHILPLGAEESTRTVKDHSLMRLFYVGSLDGRGIHLTVEGFDRFAAELKEPVELSYEIVGFGSAEEEERLRSAISRASSRDRITFFGRIPHTELRPFLERNTVGVAFIPLQQHYQNQPATKLFEYLLAGMPVLATATKENARVIDRRNGVLFEDTAEGFYRGMKELCTTRHTYDSNTIRATAREYTWERIIDHNLLPYITSIMGPEQHHDTRRKAV